MKYVFLLAVMAAVFLVCFLVDLLVRRLLRGRRMQTGEPPVRPPRRSAVFGVILLFVPLVILLRLMPEGDDTLMLLGSIVSLLLGAVMLVHYFSVTIWYSDETFQYCRLLHGRREFRYSQIRGQRSLITRSGVETILFVADEEIPLSGAMQNLNPFLKRAFTRWCAVRGIDPDSVENNPRLFTWFPDPDGPDPSDAP